MTRQRASANWSIGGPAVGDALVASKDVPILSATGSTRMGGIVGPKRRRPLGPPDPGAWRQQCDDRRPLGRSWKWPCARLPSVRRGHGGPALHLAPPSDRASLRFKRRSGRAAGQGLRQRCPWAIRARPGTLIGPLIDMGARDRMLAHDRPRQGRRRHASMAGKRSPRACRGRRLCLAPRIDRDAGPDRHGAAKNASPRSFTS